MIGSELGGNMNVLFGTSGLGSEDLDSSLHAALSRLNVFCLNFSNARSFVSQRRLRGSAFRSLVTSRDSFPLALNSGADNVAACSVTDSYFAAPGEIAVGAPHSAESELVPRASRSITNLQHLCLGREPCVNDQCNN